MLTPAHLLPRTAHHMRAGSLLFAGTLGFGILAHRRRGHTFERGDRRGTPWPGQERLISVESASAAPSPAPSPAVTVRPLAEDDGDALAAFGSTLPEDDWLYLDIDLQSRNTVDRLVRAHAATNWRQVVAVAGAEIVGYANVRTMPGWQSHVGDAHLVISPAQRRRGLGTSLAQAIIVAGAELGVIKLILEMVEEQTAGRQIFERLGFRQEGLLADQARDQHGRTHNLLVLGCRLPDPNTG